MKITLILHEATRTGAPRVGGLIARELAEGADVHVIVLKDGPLAPWLVELLGEERITVIAGDEFSHNIPFEQRLQSATKALGGWESDLVYVNSLAASVFALAAKALGRRVIIHVHEKAAEIYNLLRHNLTKIEVMGIADGLILAADDLSRDIIDVFGLMPENSVNFGIAIDIDAVRQSARQWVKAALNASGAPLQKSDRIVVGMCGHASPRKGADIFFASAEASPECDFLWVGGWTTEDAIENTAYELFREKQLSNFYVAGPVENPYAYINQMDLFFLSSREDPNPLVLAEAMVLHVPLLCFSKTTAVWDRLGRSGILCYGLPNVDDVTRVLAACTPAKVCSESFRKMSDPWISNFDLSEKMQDIITLIEKIQTSDGIGQSTVRLEESAA